MSAPTDIMSRKRSVARPANMVAVWFKSFSAKLYVALDKTQRKRAAEIIQRYAHLIPDGENSGEQKKAFLSKSQVTNFASFGLSLPGIVNAAAQRHKHCKGF